MRSRLCRACGDFHDVDEPWPQKCFTHHKIAAGPQIIGDLKPYKSMIDGSIIDGRKRHRDHLKAHGCIEVGNDTSHMQRKAIPITGRKESLHRMLADVSEKQLQGMIKQEIRNRRP